jgi:Cobalamin synthesis G C-terminus
LGVSLVVISQSDLAAANVRATTRSERVIALAGVPSIAEAAALAAGGPAARLIAPRIAIGPATCALADTGAAPSPLVGEGWGGGSGRCGAVVPPGTTPTPDPSPQGGGEQKGHRAICDGTVESEATP